MPVIRDQRERDRNKRRRERRLDNVFHRLIISLERLEIFLEGIRLQGNTNKELVVTAVNSTRDSHNDVTNPPSRDSFFGEVQLQCSALYFQTDLKDKAEFDSYVRHFLIDLLEWYGGRNEEIPYNGVDAFVLPIIISLSQQAKGVEEIIEVTDKYVAQIPDISSFTDEEKADAISNAMEKLIVVMDKHHHEEQELETEDKDFVFTPHRRGNAVDGYKRLIMAMLNLYDEAMPAVVVFRTISNFLPQITETVPTISESSITAYIETKNTTKQEENSQDNCNAPTEQVEAEGEKADSVQIKDDSESAKEENNIPFQEIEDKADVLISDEELSAHSKTDEREADNKQTFFQKITKFLN